LVRAVDVLRAARFKYDAEAGRDHLRADFLGIGEAQAGVRPVCRLGRDERDLFKGDAGALREVGSGGVERIDRRDDCRVLGCSTVVAAPAVAR
jgi:hypothetical protein